MKTMRMTGKLIFIFIWMGMILNCAGPQESTETIKFYVGSSDGSLEHSIFLCELDPVGGVFSVLDSFAGAIGPSYLAFSPDREFLYSINKEISDTAANHMTVSSFTINKEHELVFLNSQSSEGNGPCHVHLSKKGSHLFTANYFSGHVATFPIARDGRIEPASSVVVGSGSGPVENRQGSPHAHQVTLDPNNRFLLVPDLGADKILIYEFDPDSGVLTPNPAQPFLKMSPGAGPRHLAFHPLGEIIYVVNELNSTITSCRYYEEDGTLNRWRVVNTVTDSHVGSKYPAAVRVHPNGNYVYASTRGENSCISVFEVGEDGEFFRIQVVDDVTNWPRDFNIDPSGQFLLAAGEHSDEIELYRIDKESGKLSHSSSKFSLPSPGCILFID
jgi:6-phosphogluconolactonase